VPRVHIQPSDIDLDVERGESVAEAAWRQGYVWPTRCWGQADCMSCFTRIVDGEMSAVPADEFERDAIRLRMNPRLRSNPLIRLACQLKVRGSDLVLDKPGVRLAEAADHNMTEPQGRA
jgi:2Fe-2S ferredoxin